MEQALPDKHSKLGWAARRQLAWFLTNIQLWNIKRIAWTQDVVIAFHINEHELPTLAAIAPNARTASLRYARRKRGWTRRDAEFFAQKIADLCKSPRVTLAAWGRRDFREFQFDLLQYSERKFRLEAGLYAGRSSLQNNRTSVIPCKEGVYFDGSSASSVERTLNALNPGRGDELDAKRLLQHILSAKLTKYQLTDSEETLPEDALLIVGQCTGDQAIEFTPSLTKTNPGLVEAVLDRVATPGQPVFFKAHPYNPVLAEDAATIARDYPDVIQLDAKVNITSMLAQKPCVATTTSGVGLEAAIRGCQVHTFGTAFYSNWGFTTDHLPCDRRTNRLSASDVFASVVIDQTKYLDPDTGRVIPAMEAFGLS